MPIRIFYDAAAFGNIKSYWMKNNFKKSCFLIKSSILIVVLISIL